MRKWEYLRYVTSKDDNVVQIMDERGAKGFEAFAVVVEDARFPWQQRIYFKREITE